MIRTKRTYTKYKSNQMKCVHPASYLIYLLSSLNHNRCMKIILRVPYNTPMFIWIIVERNIDNTNDIRNNCGV